MLESLTIERKKFLEILYASVLTGIGIFLWDRPLWTEAIVDWLQFGLIFILFVRIVRDEQNYENKIERDAQAVSQFFLYWKWLWCTWLFLYLFFSVSDTFAAINNGPLNQWPLNQWVLNRWLLKQWLLKHGPLQLPTWSAIVNLVANTTNNLQSYFIFVLFLVMTKKTTGETQKLIRIVSQPIIAGIVMIAVLELTFSVLGPGVFQRANASDTALSIAKAIALNGGTVFNIFSGLFAGVAFCLFFSRLGSHYIDLHPGWMAALFLYATIQPLYPLFRILDVDSTEPTAGPETEQIGQTILVAMAGPETEQIGLKQAPKAGPETEQNGLSKTALETIKITLKISAAILKFSLYLRVNEILKSKRLLFFMNRIAKDDEALAREFEKFQVKRNTEDAAALGGA